jgi:hypothetical protein
MTHRHRTKATADLTPIEAELVRRFLLFTTASEKLTAEERRISHAAHLTAAVQLEHSERIIDAAFRGLNSLGDIIEAAVRRGKKNNRKGAIPSKTK